MFYRGVDYTEANPIWVVEIQTEKGFSAGKPHLLLEPRGFGSTKPAGNWDIWPDGRGFLAVKPGEPQSQPVTEMILIQNWFEELKRLVPAK